MKKDKVAELEHKLEQILEANERLCQRIDTLKDDNKSLADAASAAGELTRRYDAACRQIECEISAREAQQVRALGAELEARQLRNQLDTLKAVWFP